MKNALAAAVTFSLGLGLASANASIVPDGFFNDPVAGGNFTTINAGAHFGAGDAWLVTSGSVVINNGSVDEIGSYWPLTPGGSHSVDLDGNSPGGISQTINFASAGNYVLKYYLAGNPDGGASTKYLGVSVAGATANPTYTTSTGFGPWTLEELFFNVASAGTATLSFQSADRSGPYGPVIGEVSISAVPEPATWAMMIVGFLGLGFLGYRKSSTGPGRPFRLA